MAGVCGDDRFEVIGKVKEIKLNLPLFDMEL